MRSWLRKLKGALGLGSIWGLLGTAVGTVAAVAVTVLGGTPLLTSWLTWALPLGFVSFVLGTGFGGMLGLLERHRTLDELSFRRVAAWGTVVGAAFPVAAYLVALGMGLPWTDLSFVEVLRGLGAACSGYGIVTAGLAGGTVWAARRAPPELPAGAVAAGELEKSVDESLLHSGTTREDDPGTP